MKTRRLVAGAGVLSLLLGLAACGGYEGVDLAGLKNVPTATLTFAGSGVVNGKYLFIGSTSYTGPGTVASACDTDLTGECLGLGAVAGFNGRNVRSNVCPGTWSFDNLEIYDDNNCLTDAAEVVDASCITGLASYDITLAGPNLVDITCALQGTNVTFDVTVD